MTFAPGEVESFSDSAGPGVDCFAGLGLFAVPEPNQMPIPKVTAQIAIEARSFIAGCAGTRSSGRCRHNQGCYTRREPRPDLPTPRSQKHSARLCCESPDPGSD